MIPTTRTEYGNTDGTGDGKTVLRAIFQFSPNSWRATSASRRNKFQLYFWDFEDPSRITKIITKKLNTITSTGTAVNWSHTPETIPHSFARKTLYYKNHSLCFEGPDGGSSTSSWWNQYWSAGEGPEYSTNGWVFKFTVTDNPNTNSFTGSLNCYINTELSLDNSTTTDDDGNPIPESLGIKIEDIQVVGDYEVHFNFENPESTNMDLTDDITGPWTIIEPGGATNTTLTVLANQAEGEANKIEWYANVGEQLVCGVRNILLANKTKILLGGTVGSWDWQGFDNSEDNFITWEDVVDATTGVQENRIMFTNCPLDDGLGEVISASQHLDTPIKKHEHYAVSIDHGIIEGDLSIYYFNNDGFGFRILDLNDTNQGTVTTNVTIGDAVWESENPDGAYTPEMKETFVIKPQLGSVDVNGWIDNITMVRNFAREEDESGNPIFEAKTISFSEKVNGWTSFKSFVPESGVSLSKKYFTFKEGGLFQHYAPMVYNGISQEWMDSTDDLAENYNIFYDVDTYVSSIKAVLNDKPDVVKTFNTLNYEGSKSYIVLPSSVQQVNTNNAEAWSSASNIMGWKCTEIKTNLEAGSVTEFINKEDKWFSYIKGTTHTLGHIDTSRFSVQGIGPASTVTATPIMVQPGETYE